MRSLKAGLFTFVTAGFFGMAAVIGCSADGASDVIEDPNATEPTDDGAQLPPSSSGSSSSSSGSTTSKDAGKDASKTDAGKDAGPPPPNPGDACTKVDQIFTKSCGKCGTQQAVCLADGDGGAGKVSDYSPCDGEKGVCVAGTVEDVACGNCGTAKRTCNQYCAWSTGACGGQPANSCSPGNVEYSSAGCTVAGSYRNRSCGNTCTWSTFTTSCAEPNNPNQLAIAGSANGTVTGTYTISTSKLGKRQPTYTCGTGTVSATADYAYELVELRNNTGKTATISVTWPKGDLQTTIAAYTTNLPPQTDAELIACTDADYNGTSYDGVVSGVSMPPNARFLLRIASYYSTSDATKTTSGATTITVKTTALN